MEEKIRAILREQVDPVLQEHFGGSSLSKYEDGVLTITLPKKEARKVPEKKQILIG